MTLDEYIKTLTAAPAKIETANAALLMAAIGDLRDYGQSIGHEQSGRMDATMHINGPFATGSGTIEASFQSGVPYADLEVARGGSHDWATRTINEQQPRITQLQTDVENALVTALVGAS